MIVTNMTTHVHRGLVKLGLISEVHSAFMFAFLAQSSEGPLVTSKSTVYFLSRIVN